MASIPYIDRKLPKDQQKLAEAANNNSNRTSVSDHSKNILSDVAFEGGIGLTALGTGKIATATGLTGTGAMLTKGGAAMTGPVGLASAASFGGGYALGTALDEEYNLSGKLANKIIPDSSLNRPAITPAEEDLMDQGYNLSKPKFKTISSTTGNPYGAFAPPVRVQDGYEKRSNSTPISEFGATEMRKRERETPAVQNTTGQYEALFARRNEMSPDEFRLGLAKIAGEGNEYVEKERQVEAGISQTPDMDEYYKAHRGTVPLEIAQARNEAGMQEVYSAPNKEFESMYEKDGKMFGVLRGSNIRKSFENPIEMSEEDVNRFNQTMSATNAPIVSGTPEEGLRGFKDRNGNTSYGNEAAIDQFTPQKPEAPKAPEGSQASGGLSPLADEVLTEYAEFVESGEPMTADKQAYFETIGGMTGRTFDANDGGFSKEFNPQIMENFQRRVDEGVIDTSGLGREEFQKFANTDRRSSLQMATDEMNQRRAQSTADYEANRSTIAGGSTVAQTSEFQDRNQNGIEDRKEGIAFDRNPNRMREEFGKVVNDFNIPDIRVGGQMVDATKENRALLDIEKGIKEEARELGLSSSATRAYVADKMRERSEAQQDRSTRGRMDELNIQNTQEGMDSRRMRDQLALQNANRVETATISPSVLKSAQEFFEKNGVTFDPETGALQTDKEVFLLPDGKVNLSPDSPLVALIRGTNTGVPMEGAEAFLAPPPSVTSKLQEAEVGQLIRSDDGRVYQVLENKQSIQLL